MSPGSKLYLGDGPDGRRRTRRLAGYLLEAPLVDYPLRLVAYDHHGLVIGVVTLKGDTRPVGIKPPPVPVANAHWRVVVSNSAGKAYVAPSTSGGTCYAVEARRGAEAAFGRLPGEPGERCT